VIGQNSPVIIKGVISDHVIFARISEPLTQRKVQIRVFENEIASARFHPLSEYKSLSTSAPLVPLLNSG
jgi:hypothetical protein